MKWLRSASHHFVSRGPSRHYVVHDKAVLKSQLACKRQGALFIGGQSILTTCAFEKTELYISLRCCTQSTLAAKAAGSLPGNACPLCTCMKHMTLRATLLEVNHVKPAERSFLYCCRLFYVRS